jgi:hypothetical protein
VTINEVEEFRRQTLAQSDREAILRKVKQLKKGADQDDHDF